jgi:integrase
VKLGFVDYAQQQTAQGHKRLFPDIPMAKSKQRYSATFTKVFANAMKTLKLKKENENFHSFRHTMVDALRAAQVEEGVMMTLVGHKDDRQTATYGKGYPLAVLKKAIDKVEYGFIDWSKVGVIANP